MSGYIGTAPVPQATQTRDSFTATSGQTSFATGGYTPNFLDIFLNGVKLSAADYTASNGSDVVLASGAATGDILEVVAFTTFTPADLPSGTPSIDDNGNATALTIDSSENVLIGKTATGGNVAGMQIINGSFFSHVRDGGVVQVLNRKSSDGDILSFEKDNTAVGSVATYGGDLIVGTGDTRLRFVDSLDSLLPVSNSTGTSRDAGIDLGHSETRFKDIYTSGGIYLGAASSSTPVAANKLDDYEEGTWTPTFPNGGTIGSVNSATYTKVGQLVFAGFYISGISSIPSTSTTFNIGGLPFNVTAGSGYQAGGGISYVNGANWASTNAMNTPLAQVNTAFFYFHRDDGNTNAVKSTDASVLNGQEMICSIIYQTSA